MSLADVVAAWDQADPTAIHPTRAVSEDAYWDSGRAQADLITAVLKPGTKVVDVGAGDGRVAIPLRAAGLDVTAADASTAMLGRITDRDPDMPTVQTTGTDLYAVLGRKTDAVVCLAVLIHYDYATALDILRGLREAVKAGGTLILDWPVSDQPTEAHDWIGVTTWSREQQDQACAELGLQRIDTDLPWPAFKAVKPGGGS